MNYCSNCGEKIINNSNTCIKCGMTLSNINPNDAPSKGLALLSFFIPLIGIILYITWHNTNPKKSKSCGKGALIGFIVSLVLFILIFGLYIYSIIDNNKIINNESPINENTQSLGNLKNTRWHFYESNWVGNDLITVNETIEFGNGNYLFKSETSTVGGMTETETEIGTYKVTGDNVILTSSDEKEKIGILIGRSLTINNRTYR